MGYPGTNLNFLIGQAGIHLANAGQARPAEGLGVCCNRALTLTLQHSKEASAHCGEGADTKALK